MLSLLSLLFLFFFVHPSTTPIYPLSLHDALPISLSIHDVRALLVDDLPLVVHHVIEFDDLLANVVVARFDFFLGRFDGLRSEEHTSELQSPYDLVCRLLLEKKKKTGTARMKTYLPQRQSTSETGQPGPAPPPSRPR